MAERGAWYRWQGDKLILQVRVQPRASRDEIVGPYGEGSLKVRISAPPVDGKANQHLLKFIARAFGVTRSQVALLKGSTGRDKQLEITAPGRIPTAAQIDNRIVGQTR
ncbi:MAG: DUF167 family protein [Gammaproteobacteria bacterium]|nr:DUF167 family protein [Gammaproteobacteria bacterium]